MQVLKDFFGGKNNVSTIKKAKKQFVQLSFSLISCERPISLFFRHEIKIAHQRTRFPGHLRFSCILQYVCADAFKQFLHF